MTVCPGQRRPDSIGVKTCLLTISDNFQVCSTHRLRLFQVYRLTHRHSVDCLAPPCRSLHRCLHLSDKCVFAGRFPSATRWHGSRCDPRESRQQYDSAVAHFLPSFFSCFSSCFVLLLPASADVPNRFSSSCLSSGKTIFGRYHSVMSLYEVKSRSVN